MTTLNDPKLLAAAELSSKSRKSDKRWKLGLAIAVLLLAAVTAIAVVLGSNNARLATENAEFASRQQVEKKEIAQEARQALCGSGDREIYDRDLCEKWAEAAQEPNVVPTAPAVVGGPSQPDLVNAFREYCAGGNCKGQDGQPPTPDDVAAAFARFCSDGRCTGPAGKDAIDGKDGKDGADGTDAQPLPPSPEMVLAAVTDVCSTGVCRGADGATGPPPTPESILAAVQQFCAADACRGAAGADGQKGDKGDKGDPPSSIVIVDPKTGQTLTCTPDPPGSTTYTCAAAATPEASPAPPSA